MTWLAKLYETYESASAQPKEKIIGLAPYYHKMERSHIEVVINEKGEFQTARYTFIKKDKKISGEEIIIPITPKSLGAKTSGSAPSPLAEKIHYVAGDYEKYYSKDKKLSKPYFSDYKKQFSEWFDSDPLNKKLIAIKNYLDKRSLISDLLSINLLYLDEQNVLIDKWEGKNKPILFSVVNKQSDTFIRWCVEGYGIDESRTWVDQDLMRSWQNYQYKENKACKNDYCQIKSMESFICKNHPKIVENQKLISEPTCPGYLTYKGRFIESKESLSISFEVSQKAHNALRWLISRQGYRNGNQVILVWAISGEKMRPPVEEQWKIEQDQIEEEQTNNPKPEKKKNKEIDHSKNLGQVFAERLKKRLAGYRASISDDAQITLMILDSATPGRMAIVYYQELNKADYFGAIDAWEKELAWHQRITITNEKAFELEAPPAPALIAKVAYGESGDEKVKKQTIERLFPCIVEKKQIPKDLVESCVRAASNSCSYKSDEQWRWSRNISVACSVYKGWRARHFDVDRRRDYKMSLEKNYDGRDYLYGRLLALAEKIEERALQHAGENRITNAQRMMQRFSVKPYTTWKSIRDSLQPYINRLKVSKDAGLLGFWEREIGEINNLFKREEFTDDRKLSGEFLLGYYCQKNFKKDESEPNEVTNEGVENGSN